MRFYLTIIAILATLASIAQGSALTQSQKHLLDSIALQDVPPNAPGVAVAVIKNGKLIYERYAGYANLTDSTKITSRSRFNIASNGKQFTAFAILKLQQQGKVQLNDDIRKYFPTLYRKIPGPIKIVHLITHSSGIRDVYDLWALQGITWWKQTFGNEDALKLLEKQNDLNFTPGTTYQYSNSNYILLAELISKISGKTFREFTNELFAELKMTNTGFETDYTNIRGEIALPYFNFNTWTGYNWTCNIHGDGNLFSTLEDQIKWEIFLQGPKGQSKLTAISATSQQAVDKSYDKYGYGLEFGSYKKINYKFHEGATGAWKATVIRFPSQKLSIVTLSNSGKTITADQTRQMADVMLGLQKQSGTFAIKPAKIGTYVSDTAITGVYLNETGFAFRFERRDTSLYLIRSNRNDIKLRREALNILHQQNDPDFKMEFTTSAQGLMEVTAYYTTHAPYTLTRPYADWKNFNYQLINGEYYNGETDVTMVVKYQREKNYVIEINNNKREAVLVTPGLLLSDNYMFRLEPTSQPMELLLDAGRIKTVRFVKR